MNLVRALPDEPRTRYLNLAEDLRALSYEKIGEIFGKNMPDFEKVMKGTMKQFGELFLANPTFDAKGLKSLFDIALQD
jgi:hypothetical protein